MVFAGEEEVHPERNLAIRVARKFFPVSDRVRRAAVLHPPERARVALTPLALVLLMVETTDLIFALDSIPAIFGVTQNPSSFSPRTCSPSWVCARSTSSWPGAIEYFRYLKIGLSIVLVFIGVKMLHRTSRRPSPTPLVVSVGHSHEPLLGHCRGDHLSSPSCSPSSRPVRRKQALPPPP